MCVGGKLMIKIQVAFSFDVLLLELETILREAWSFTFPALLCCCVQQFRGARQSGILMIRAGLGQTKQTLDYGNMDTGIEGKHQDTGLLFWIYVLVWPLASCWGFELQFSLNAFKDKKDYRKPLCRWEGTKYWLENISLTNILNWNVCETRIDFILVVQEELISWQYCTA